MAACKRICEEVSSDDDDPRPTLFFSDSDSDLDSSDSGEWECAASASSMGDYMAMCSISSEMWTRLREAATGEKKHSTATLLAAVLVLLLDGCRRHEELLRILCHRTTTTDSEQPLVMSPLWAGMVDTYLRMRPSRSHALLAVFDRRVLKRKLPSYA